MGKQRGGRVGGRDGAGGTVVRELRVDTQTEAQENTADGEWAPPSWTAAAPPSRPQRQPLTAVPAPPGSSCLLGPDLAQTNVGPCLQIQLFINQLYFTFLPQTYATVISSINNLIN